MVRLMILAVVGVVVGGFAAADTPASGSGVPPVLFTENGVDVPLDCGGADINMGVYDYIGLETHGPAETLAQVSALVAARQAVLPGGRGLDQVPQLFDRGNGVVANTPSGPAQVMMVAKGLAEGKAVITNIVSCASFDVDPLLGSKEGVVTDG